MPSTWCRLALEPLEARELLHAGPGPSPHKPVGDGPETAETRPMPDRNAGGPKVRHPAQTVAPMRLVAAVEANLHTAGPSPASAADRLFALARNAATPLASTAARLPDALVAMLSLELRRAPEAMPPALSPSVPVPPAPDELPTAPPAEALPPAETGLLHSAPGTDLEALAKAIAGLAGVPGSSGGGGTALPHWTALCCSALGAAMAWMGARRRRTRQPGHRFPEATA